MISYSKHIKCTLHTVFWPGPGLQVLPGMLENGLFLSVRATLPSSSGNTHLARLCSDICIFQRHTQKVSATLLILGNGRKI